MPQSRCRLSRLYRRDQPTLQGGDSVNHLLGSCSYLEKLTVTEHVNELGMVIDGLLVRKYADTLQLPLQGVLGKSGLSHVGPVQAIHTV